MITTERAHRAIEENYGELYRLMCAHGSDSVRSKIKGVMVTGLPYPHPLFNFASMTNISLGEEEEVISSVKEFFSARALPWTWMIGPSAQPHDMRARLLRAGLLHAYDTPAMLVDLQSYVHAETPNVVEIADDVAFAIWLDVLVRSFKLPQDFRRSFEEFQAGLGWQLRQARYFCAMEDGQPAAVSMVFYAVGVAGIYCVGTIEEFRRRGFGEQVTRACLAAAVQDGYDAAMLHSSKMGLPLYEKLGFKEYAKLSYFVPS